MAKEMSHYVQESSYSIATEILADPKASIRETVLAQRIRGDKSGDRYSWSDSNFRNEHRYD